MFIREKQLGSEMGITPYFNDNIYRGHKYLIHSLYCNTIRFALEVNNCNRLY